MQTAAGWQILGPVGMAMCKKSSPPSVMVYVFCSTPSAVGSTETEPYGPTLVVVPSSFSPSFPSASPWLRPEMRDHGKASYP